MHPRLFRLIEAHQRIDEALRLAQLRRRPNLMEIVRLEELKLRAKSLIHRFAGQAARA